MHLAEEGAVLANLSSPVDEVVGKEPPLSIRFAFWSGPVICVCVCVFLCVCQVVATVECEVGCILPLCHQQKPRRRAG